MAPVDLAVLVPVAEDSLAVLAAAASSEALVAVVDLALAALTAPVVLMALVPAVLDGMDVPASSEAGGAAPVGDVVLDGSDVLASSEVPDGTVALASLAVLASSEVGDGVLSDSALAGSVDAVSATLAELAEQPPTTRATTSNLPIRASSRD